MKKNSFAESKGKKSQQFYIDNIEFYTACVERKKAVSKAKKEGVQKPQLTKYLGECLLKIASKMSESSHFRNYPFREDMIMDGVENCVQYFDNFDPAKSKNPFAYYSQICYFSFLRKIGKERDYLYNSYQLGKNAKFVAVDPFVGKDDTFEPEYETKPDTTMMQDFVEKYETGKRKAKAKSKANAAAKAKSLLAEEGSKPAVQKKTAKTAKTKTPKKTR